VPEAGCRETARKWANLLLALPALLAVILVLIATTDGVGISADSVIYISVAREIAAGHGIVVPFGTPQPTPLGTRVAPLLPMILAALNRAGVDPVVGARWLNALLFGGTVWLVGCIVLRATGVLWPAVCCSAFLATSRQMLAIHEMAWTEPVFFLLCTSAMLFLARHASTGKYRPLVGTCVLLVLCLLARWAAAAFVVAAFACLMLGDISWRRRIIALLCIAALLCLPMFPGGPTWLTYIVQCLRVGPELAQPDSHERAQLVSNLWMGAGVVSDWLWPWPLSRFAPGRVGAVVLTVAFACAVIALALCARFSASFKKSDAAAGLRAHLCWILGLSLAAYPLFLLVVMIFFGKNKLVWDGRILSPLMIPSLLLGVLGGFSLWESAGRRRGVAILALTACVALLAIRLPRAVDRSIELAHTSGGGGEGFHDAKWRTSPTIAALKDLPAETPLYSNAADAVYFLAGRPAHWLPSRWNLAHPDAARDDDYTKPDDLRAALAQGGLIVLFDRLAWRRAMPTPDDLSVHFALERINQFADGALYAASGDARREQSRDRKGAATSRSGWP